MIQPAVTALEAVCLDWLYSNLDCFAIDWRADAAEIYRRLRPYAELGLAAYVDPLVPVSDVRERLILWLKDHAPEPNALRDVVREYPQAFPWAGMMLQHRAALGIAAPGLRAVVDDLSRQRFVRYFERPIGHDIAVHNIMCHIGHDPVVSLRQLYSRTMLAHKTWDDPSDTALYFLCHDVFFLTDWGKRKLPAYVQNQATWLRKFAHWHQERAASQNIDLAAELWLAMSFWQADASAVECSAVPLTSDPAGSVFPIPKSQGTSFIRQGDAGRQIAFFQNYHTVLVSLLALIRGWATVH
jgi:hypothetical protein